MELEIEIFWHTDATRQMEESCMSFDRRLLENRTMTFYQIDAIAPAIWNKEEDFCSIWVGGEKWTTPYSYEHMKELIRKARL